MIAGVVAINKPCGYTSSDVVVKCRNAYSKAVGQKVKCGHMGTLDPNASGVLLVGFGKATKLFDFLLDKTKVYVAEFVFGKQTDTLDECGIVVAESDLPKVSDVENAIKQNIGQISQIPPNYSAKSINGKRAYVLAREGVEFEIPSKVINIENIELLETNIVDERCQSIKVRITCGSGTYIRSLARDIAAQSDCVGYMRSLERTICGGFCVENSVLLDEFVAEPCSKVVSVQTFLSQIFEVIDIENEEKIKQICNGCAIEYDKKLENNAYIVTIKGKLLGLANVSNDGQLKVVINLWE
ncbi:MAG: tRNA pseudouridine(55) synthase TruB [Clostridia bacterium]